MVALARGDVQHQKAVAVLSAFSSVAVNYELYMYLLHFL